MSENYVDKKNYINEGNKNATTINFDKISIFILFGILIYIFSTYFRYTINGDIENIRPDELSDGYEEYEAKAYETKAYGEAKAQPKVSIYEKGFNSLFSLIEKNYAEVKWPALAAFSILFSILIVQITSGIASDLKKFFVVFIIMFLVLYIISNFANAHGGTKLMHSVYRIKDRVKNLAKFQ